LIDADGTDHTKAQLDPNAFNREAVSSYQVANCRNPVRVAALLNDVPPRIAATLRFAATLG